MIYIVIPAYNEEGSIGSLLSKLETFLKGQKIHLIVVDDGCKDRTKEIALSFQDRIDMEVISHPTNLGVGAAFRTGLSRATALSQLQDVIVMIEADDTNDPAIILSLASQVENGSDVVCASRYVKGGGYYNFPLNRLIISWCANTIFWILFHVPKVRDYTIFFRAYRAATLMHGFKVYGDDLITTRGFGANAEILVRLYKMGGVTFSEYPLVYKYGLKRSKSKMKVMRNIREYRHLVWKLMNIKQAPK